MSKDKLDLISGLTSSICKSCEHNGECYRQDDLIKKAEESGVSFTVLECDDFEMAK